MFSELNRPFRYLASQRLAEAESRIRQIEPDVREEYLAQVTAVLNEALSLGDRLSRRIPVVRNSPAGAGQVDANFAILARDMEWIGGQMRMAYEESIRLFNEFAGVQTTLRRLLRSRLFSAHPRLWSLSLLDPGVIAEADCMVDTISGFAALPAVSQREIRPESVRIGLGSQGVPQEGFRLDELFDGRPDTALLWKGPRLELVFRFSAPAALNAVALDVMAGDGLVIEELASTPDEAAEESWLGDLPAGAAALDGSSAKFSGDWIHLARPRFVKQLRLVLADRTGIDPIRLSGVRFLEHSFRPAGRLTTGRIDGYAGLARLEADEFLLPPMTQITHWISQDGMTFSPVLPGSSLRIAPGGFWYRAQLVRSDSAFQISAADLVLPAYDADGEPVLPEQIASTDLGGGLVERMLRYGSLQGELVFREEILPASIEVRHGGLPLAAQAWNYSGGVLRLSGVLSAGVEIRYRTSSYGRGLQPRLAGFASPVLYGVRLVFL